MNQRGKLPMLDNVRQGNSLISGTPAELEAAFGPAWRDKHPFNWADEFPQVMARGGFDVIVGNPPYIRIQTLPKDDAAWYGEHYRAASGSYDIYVLFVERALQLLRPGGMMGFILPNKFFQASYGQQLRGLLSEQQTVWQVVDFGDAQVFEDATTYTCLLFLRKAPNPRLTYVAAADWLKAQPERPALLPDDLPATQVDAARLDCEPWAFASAGSSRILTKMEERGHLLVTLVDKLFVGLQTSADAIYILDVRDVDEAAGIVTAYSKERGRTYKLEMAVAKPLLKGSLDMRRYRVEQVSRYVIFPYQEGKLIPPKEFAKRYPGCWAYLRENRERLESREHSKMRHEGWYGYVYPKNLTLFEQPKLLTPSIAQRASFSYDAEGRYYFVGSGGGGGGGYGITLKESDMSPLYVLGLLNSRLLDFYLQSISSPFRHGWYAYNKQYIERLPIRRINFSDPADVARHDRMVALVEEMLRVQREHAEAEAAKEDRRHDLARRIEQLDAQIDALVYELYGLTEEEIAIVEGSDHE